MSLVSLVSQIQTLARCGVWEWDISRNELTWSPELRAILGVAEDASVTFEEWLAHVHPDDLSTVKGYFTRARRERGEATIEYRVIRGEQVRTLLARLRSMTRDDGTIYCVGIDQDITESKAVAARVVFSDRMVSIGTLAGGVAHEINNPLATISANLQLLADTYDMSLIEESLRAVDRIRTIVRGLKAFSRGNDDKRQSIDLVRVLELAISLTSSEVRHRARLVSKLDPVPWIRADEGRLGQVFINLLVNAAEAIPDARAAENEIRVDAHTDAAGWAVVEISDTGRGIARDIQPRVFDPFFTTKPVGQGTGLGLSICHGIVRALGGDITFRTELGRGTTFIVALPPSEAPAVRPSPPPITILPGRRAAILLVDDESTFVSSMRRLLAAEYEVMTASSGREALDRINNGEHFDVILCDLMMPEMTGAELHAALVERDPEQAKRMIFVTGGAFSPASQVFLESITNPCFEKPCDLRKLREAIRLLVDTDETVRRI
jgi:PAS domain S-box-containing protein